MVFAVELDHGERVGARQEGDFGAALWALALHRRIAGDEQRRYRIAMREFDQVLFAVAPDAQLQPRRQRIDHGDADAVQAAGHFVGILVEFPAGMELRHDDFGGGDAFFRMDVGRDAAAVVGDGARAVGIERHLDQRRVAGERLVDGVIDDLVYHVMQAGAVIGVADIHARALAHGVEAAQHFDLLGAVAFG